jgi:hypothetical protein
VSAGAEDLETECCSLMPRVFFVQKYAKPGFAAVSTVDPLKLLDVRAFKLLFLVDGTFFKRV